jgi:hypothetical protein
MECDITDRRHHERAQLNELDEPDDIMESDMTHDHHHKLGLVERAKAKAMEVKEVGGGKMGGTQTDSGENGRSEENSH